MTARKPPAHLRAAETRARNRPPLPRAVRELLRDVVLLDRERQATLTPFSEFVPMSLSQRAARILGTTPGAIVARARKVRK